MISIKIIQENVKNALQFTDEVVKSFPDRLTGTESARKTAVRLKEEFSSYCNETKVESFLHRPDGFLGFIKIAVIFYIISTLIVVFKPEFIYIPLSLMILSVLMFSSQFLLYYSFFDFLAKEEEGENVYGIVEPEKEVKQQIIISGHYDAPYVFTWLEKLKSIFYAPILISGIAIFLISFIGIFIWSISMISSGATPYFSKYLVYGMPVGSILILPLFWFITGKVSPGAGDNMIAIAIANEAGKVIAEANKNKSGLKHTRIIVMAFDAEEAGLNGARAYCKDHKEELLELKTYNYNIDSIYKVKDLKFFSRDVNGIVKLSPEMLKEVKASAEKVGYSLKSMPLPLGGGATDSGEFARIGVDTCSLVGVATEPFRLNLAYHTERDTVEAIDPDSVEAVLKMLIQYILDKDENC